jgi:hypothetical protein
MKSEILKDSVETELICYLLDSCKELTLETVNALCFRLIELDHDSNIIGYYAPTLKLTMIPRYA